MDNSNVEVTKLPIEGKIILYTTGLEVDSQEVRFYCADGSCYKMWHEQDCCESVSLNDISGDISVLECAKVLSAEEYSKKGEPDDYGTSTYTFYNIRTDKGYIQLKWYGESNGYYSEDVDFKLVPDVPEYHRGVLEDIRKKLDEIIEICDGELGYFVDSLGPEYITSVKDEIRELYRTRFQIPKMGDGDINLHYVCEHCQHPIGYADIYDIVYYGHNNPMWKMATISPLMRSKYRAYIDKDGNFYVVEPGYYGRNIQAVRFAVGSTISHSAYFNPDTIIITGLSEETKFGAYCPRCGEKLPIDKPIYKGVI